MERIEITRKPEVNSVEFEARTRRTIFVERKINRLENTAVVRLSFGGSIPSISPPTFFVGFFLNLAESRRAFLPLPLSL